MRTLDYLLRQAPVAFPAFVFDIDDAAAMVRFEGRLPRGYKVVCTPVSAVMNYGRIVDVKQTYFATKLAIETLVPGVSIESVIAELSDAS